MEMYEKAWKSRQTYVKACKQTKKNTGKVRGKYWKSTGNVTRKFQGRTEKIPGKYQETRKLGTGDVLEN